MVQYDNGIEFPVPHRKNANKDASVNVSTYDLATTAESTGAHVITYTKPSYKFHEATGYVQLPSVSVQSTSTRIDNSIPYMFFGGYQTVDPWKGFDAGLCYYKSLGGWKLFVNTGQWYENPSGPVIKASNYVDGKLYLNMKLVNGYVRIIVRDPSNWSIIDQIDYYLSPAFTSSPSNIELTREVALAQHSRILDGSKLTNAHWSDVYFYSTTLTTKATSTYLQSSHPGRISYSSTYPCYLVGDTLEDKNFITISNPLKYYEEYVTIQMSQ
ncbi:hypothetical protein [Thermotalea metallivorans]|uniref:Uncharacterized protein n=1 Tax=Thermotalea metallivorans TaxID=520762 RepID=A0A140LEH9_9FIRM|nr:hypothetical protein [Thermotalea metallivorans]KXG78954.1 hypothetical protein AN619_01140 [Thermotalea metallivorans]